MTTGVAAERDRMAEALRARILSEPSLVLDDPEVMRALVSADRATAQRNVVDLRAVMLERLDERLGLLEDTHRAVLAAAYENVAGMNQIHRAVLAMLNPSDFAGFLRALVGDLPQILGVEVVRLGLEAPAAEPGRGLGPRGDLEQVVVALPLDGVARYVSGARRAEPRKVTLRTCEPGQDDPYGIRGATVRSEAILTLDLGVNTLPGLLAFGAADPERFHPDQGTDLLVFFAEVFERALRRWLA